MGCAVEDNVFLATGSTVFNGARIGTGTEVRINAVVHLKTVLPKDALVPIGWVAVGDPAEILPPDKHERIWRIQEPLNFPKEIFDVERVSAETMMPQITSRYTRGLGKHLQDRAV